MAGQEWLGHDWLGQEWPGWNGQPFFPQPARAIPNPSHTARYLFIVQEDSGMIDWGMMARAGMANGGLIGMRKYFDEIQNENLRLFIYRHANSENGGVLIPTFKDVLDIVTEFDGCDFRYFDIGAEGLGYLYDYYSEEESLIVKEKIKLSPLPPAIVVEDENKKLELLFERLGISSNQIVNRARTRCSYCGEKCFKYLMFPLCVRLLIEPDALQN
ncbi:hypothetical protein CDAR_598661 [Caerostris darwini]|uniref:Uncharacterized protein n=1 Tax=Caerostris darwini TaxID=1538125 RepID=A0AAV4R821_9ARAC|nr:hypothetical protein CDAR_598661 [Caerostris darwini]